MLHCSIECCKWGYRQPVDDFHWLAEEAGAIGSLADIEGAGLVVAAGVEVDGVSVASRFWQATTPSAMTIGER